MYQIGKDCHDKEEIIRYYQKSLAHLNQVAEYFRGKFAQQGFADTISAEIKSLLYETLFDRFGELYGGWLELADPRVRDFLYQHYHCYDFLSSFVDNVPETRDRFNWAFLTAMTSLVSFFPQRVKEKDLSKTIRMQSRNCAKVLEAHQEYGATAQRLAQETQERLEKISAPQSKPKVGKRIQVIQKANEFKKQQELLELAKESRSVVGSSKGIIILNCEQLQARKNQAAALLQANKDQSAYLQSIRDINQMLLQMEQEAAQSCGLELDQKSWSVADFTEIYRELDRQLPQGVIESRLSDYIAVCINAWDFAISEKRIEVFAKMMGGSTKNLQSIPTGA